MVGNIRILNSGSKAQDKGDCRNHGYTCVYIYIYTPVGLYHTPFLGYLILGLGSQNHKVGYPKERVWYEPTGIYSRILILLLCGLLGPLLH